VSSQENLGSDGTGVTTRSILLAIAQMEREFARENVAASAASSSGEMLGA
jgi:DNA invertase Pin-like site-specific DNA recombinase